MQSPEQFWANQEAQKKSLLARIETLNQEIVKLTNKHNDLNDKVSEAQILLETTLNQNQTRIDRAKIEADKEVEQFKLQTKDLRERIEKRNEESKLRETDTIETQKSVHRALLENQNQIKDLSIAIEKTNALKALYETKLQEIKDKELETENNYKESVKIKEKAEADKDEANRLKIEQTKNEEILEKIQIETDKNANILTKIEAKNDVLIAKIKASKEAEERANSQIRQLLNSQKNGR